MHSCMNTCLHTHMPAHTHAHTPHTHTPHIHTTHHTRTHTHTHTPPSTQKILVLQVEGVQGVHEFHVWQLAGNRIVLSAHITCKMGEYMGVAAAVKKLFHNEGIHSTTIQPEFVEVSIVW